MDEKIAKEVMGHTVASVGGLDIYRTEETMLDGHKRNLARYSLDMNYAIEVLEKLHDKFPSVELFPRPFVRPRIWHCKIASHGIVSDAETPAMAICNAALETIK